MRKRVQAAGDHLISAFSVRLDAELARRGSDSRYSLSVRVILFRRIPLFGQWLTDGSFFCFLCDKKLKKSVLVLTKIRFCGILTMSNNVALLRQDRQSPADPLRNGVHERRDEAR
jgi:hypothetical protein